MTVPRGTPLPKREWSAATKRWWREYWTSEAGQTLPAASAPTVSRLFGWYHRRELLERRVDKLFDTPRARRGKPADDKLFVAGSTGQPKVNPLVAELRSIEDQIDALEKRLADATPRPKGSGPAGDDAADLLAAVSARVAEAVAAHDADDPRLELLEGGAA